MKTKFFVMALILLPMVAHAQFEAVRVYGSYSSAIGTRLSVMKAAGFGGGAELRYKIEERYFVSLGVDFERYNTIEQDSALARWNWRFWNDRYAGNVRQMLQTTRGLTASLEPVQYMEVLPLLLSGGIAAELLGNLSVRQSVGGGVMFYTRSLYMDEYWARRFEELNHTFEYSFRNFAQDKKGNPFVFSAQTDIGYQLSDMIALDASLRYMTIVSSKRAFGYSELIFTEVLSMRLGISFVY